jgi:hypothetical protein
MTSHDMINAVYEGVGAVLISLNIRRLLRDKTVKGVSLWPGAWWTCWGAWNVYFYSAVNTPASFYAGIAVVLANATWLGLAVHYARRGWRPGDPNLPKPPLGMRPCFCRAGRRHAQRRAGAFVCRSCGGVGGVR